MPPDDDYDRLAAALSERLHAMLGHVEPTPAFQARLDREFAAAHGAHGASRKRRWALGASLPIVATIAAAILLFAVSDSSPAFAVTRSTDGTVTITLSDITGVGGANVKLRDLGVNNVVVVPITVDCTTQIAMSYIGVDSPAGSTVTITPGATPAGTTVVFAAEQTSQGQIEEAVGNVSGPAPTCVAPPSTNAGGAPTEPLDTTAPTTTGGDS